ncbi:DUF421 domain-containing protein [Paenibacillus sp.]|uniref:DUF421 domain-containing protein n=1 Tax=Paenibacillus sp. TaxID=58172 RepID=UPI002D2CA217|nr:YetF domain-containing protein [Paenibacillus sp.]HZG85326.1 YetF domain-containing protein [Paenibacillus sp.]
MDWIWMAVLMTLTGFVLLRLVGRKSISQMTIPTTVIMISIGSIIIQPFIEKNIWKTIGSAFIIVLLLILVEKLQLKFPWVEKLFGGQALLVVENGKLLPRNLKKMRMTVDQLEMRLRQMGHGGFEEIETATVESNGQVAVLPKPEYRPLTPKSLREALDAYFAAKPAESGERELPPLFRETAESGHPEKDIPRSLE